MSTQRIKSGGNTSHFDGAIDRYMSTVNSNN